MNEEEKELLQKTYDLSQDNNKILRGIRSSNRWAAFFRFFYWVIIIGISVGSFYYIQPYIDSVLKAYKVIQSDISTVKSVTNKLPNLSGSTIK